MKILLTQSIKNLGKKGEVKDFPQGYAQNFIIKKGYGIIATEQAIQKSISDKNKEKQDIEKIHDQKIQSIQKSNGLQIEFKLQSNEYGVLFSSIGKKEILLELKKQISPYIEDDMILIEEPIKRVGEYVLKLKYEIYSSEIKIIVKR